MKNSNIIQNVFVFIVIIFSNSYASANSEQLVINKISDQTAHHGKLFNMEISIGQLFGYSDGSNFHK